MAISENATPDSETKRWFVYAIVGTILYVATVFFFVITADVGTEPAQKESHGHAD
jgi:hypothetical protein